MAMRQKPMNRSYAGHFLLLFLLTRQAFACSVDEDYLAASVAERTSVASHVAVAGFSEVDDRLVVTAWLKGSGPQRIEVLNKHPCDGVPRHYEKIITFLTPGQNPDQFELLSYGIWSGGEEASPSNLKEAKEVLELGLYDYLRRQGRLIKVVGTIQDEATKSLQALLKIPGHEHIFRVSPGDVIHETTSKILEVTSTVVTLEMVTWPKSNLPKPVIVRLKIPD
jgi:hypothetical protein